LEEGGENTSVNSEYFRENHFFKRGLQGNRQRKGIKEAQNLLQKNLREQCAAVERGNRVQSRQNSKRQEAPQEKKNLHVKGRHRGGRKRGTRWGLGGGRGGKK